MFFFYFSALELFPGSLDRIVIFVFFHLLFPVTVLVGLTTDAPANRRLPTSAKRKKRKKILLSNWTDESGYIFDNGYGGQQRLASWCPVRYPHNPPPHGRQGMSSLLFSFFVHLYLVLGCFTSVVDIYRQCRLVMASWSGAGSISFYDSRVRLFCLSMCSVLDLWLCPSGSLGGNEGLGACVFIFEPLMLLCRLSFRPFLSCQSVVICRFRTSASLASEWASWCSIG